MVIHDINKVKSYLLKQISAKGYVSESEAEYELSQSQPQPQSQPHTQPQS